MRSHFLFSLIWLRLIATVIFSSSSSERSAEVTSAKSRALQRSTVANQIYSSRLMKRNCPNCSWLNTSGASSGIFFFFIAIYIPPNWLKHAALLKYERNSFKAVVIVLVRGNYNRQSFFLQQKSRLRKIGRLFLIFRESGNSIRLRTLYKDTALKYNSCMENLLIPQVVVETPAYLHAVEEF